MKSITRSSTFDDLQSLSQKKTQILFWGQNNHDPAFVFKFNGHEIVRTQLQVLFLLYQENKNIEKAMSTIYCYVIFFLEHHNTYNTDRLKSK